MSATLTRRQFVTAGGSLVVGFSLVGTRLFEKAAKDCEHVGLISLARVSTLPPSGRCARAIERIVRLHERVVPPVGLEPTLP